MSSSSIVSMPSASTVRPQSMVSATEGTFLSCMARSTPDDAHQLCGDLLRQFRNPRQQDAAFQIGVREVDVQEQAPSFERLGQLAGGVGGQQHERCALGLDGAELGHRHREIGQHLQQQTLDLDIGLVGLIDEQDRRVGTSDRGQQWAAQQELLAEHIGLGLVPVTGARGPGLDPQDLLGMVPLVEARASSTPS